MLKPANLWHEKAGAYNNPQAADYSRLARRPALTIAGFTIIEVLIVLAIAGLILLIVFLAVPALQRNSRNAGRKEDAGRIAAAINDFVSNNGGSLPQNNAAWVSTNCPAILSDAGTLNQYSDITSSGCVQNQAAEAAGNFVIISPGGSVAMINVTGDEMVLAVAGSTMGTTGESCDATISKKVDSSSNL